MITERGIDDTAGFIDDHSLVKRGPDALSETLGALRVAVRRADRGSGAADGSVLH